MSVMADGLGRELPDLLFSDATAIGGTPAAEHVSAFSMVFSTHPARVSARAKISGGRPSVLGRSFPLVVVAPRL
jgi:hypothetical protein